MRLVKKNTPAGYSWDCIREKGAKRYVLEEGVAYWGGSVFLLCALFARLLQVALDERMLLVLGISSLVAGAAFGIGSWHANETLYKYIVRRNKMRRVTNKVSSPAP